MRHFSVLALAAIGLLVPSAHAREQQDFRQQLRNAVDRTGKDLTDLVHRDQLDPQQRDRFDAAVKDLGELHQAAVDGKLEGGRERLERAIDNIDFVSKHAPIAEGDRQTLGIDLYTLKVIRDSWKQ